MEEISLTHSPTPSPLDLFDGLSPSSKSRKKNGFRYYHHHRHHRHHFRPFLYRRPKQCQKYLSPGGHKLRNPQRTMQMRGKIILPIPELVEAVQPKTILFIITDLKTRKQAGIKKDTFEELIKAAGIPARYFCRRSFSTWDVLMPSEDLAKNLGGSNISSKCYLLQPEYKGHRRIRVTVCNVPIQFKGDILTAYLSEYGDIEDITT